MNQRPQELQLAKRLSSCVRVAADRAAALATPRAASGTHVPVTLSDHLKCRLSPQRTGCQVSLLSDR
jgi:hypothetical protein